MSESEAVELYRKYRPTSLKEVVGQPEAVRALVEMGKNGRIPHCLLFTGPSGCGKTTIARILRKKLKCSDFDFCEVNAADDRGVDMIREIKSRMGLSPLSGESRVWLIDECATLTSQGQESFLKLLEDTPAHVYFMLCTTDPQKLKKTIITRCTEIKCKEISKGDLKALAIDVAQKEGKELDPKVAERLAEVADGSARKALVILHAVLGQATVEQQLAGIESSDVKGQAIEICRILMKKGASWSEVAAVLSKVEEDVESIRHLVLGYARSVLMKSGSERAATIIEEFRDNWYDCKAAGLAISCYRVVTRD